MRRDGLWRIIWRTRHVPVTSVGDLFAESLMAGKKCVYAQCEATLRE